MSITRKSAYESWAKRVRRVQQAYQNGIMPEDLLPVFQRFILEFGQYNANFTLDELEYLGYPKSPFCTMHMHTYLRNHETWAADLLRQHFAKDQDLVNNNVNSLFPIFLDSGSFWSEVPRMVHVVQAKVLAEVNSHEEIAKLFLAESANAEDVWIMIPKDQLAQALAMKTGLLIKIHELRKSHVIDHHVPPTLQNVFRRATQRKYSAEEKVLLDAFLKPWVDEARDKQTKRKFDKQHDPINKKQTDKLFPFFKVKRPQFLEQYGIHSSKALLDFVKASEENLALVNALYTALTEEKAKQNAEALPADDRLYASAIDKWLSARIETYHDRFYFVVPNVDYLGLNTMVLIGHKEAVSSEHWGPKALINRMGYRAPMSRLIPAVLTLYPRLFFDRLQTRLFAQAFMQLPLITGLRKTSHAEVEYIAELLEQVSEFSDGQEKTVSKTKFKAILIETDVRYKDGRLAQYRDFLLTYAKKFRNRHFKSNPLLQATILPELLEAIAEFNAAAKVKRGSQDEALQFSIAVRAAQTVAELIKLDLALEIRPELLPESIEVGIRRALRDYPVQTVTTEPYGMRAYLKILDAHFATKKVNAAPSCIVVTEQNYFESLLNLRNLHGSEATVVHVNSLLTGKFAEPDLIITEIVPNNAAKKYLEDQAIELYLKNKFNPNRCGALTLVIDITLNAFSSEFLQGVLHQAKPHIASGKLNVVLIESLTKFYQFGTDLCSGGISVTINDDAVFGEFNRFYRAPANVKIEDAVTNRYFSYFTALQNQQYIDRINDATLRLERILVDRYPELGTDCGKVFQLSSNTSLYKPYLAFNLAGVLSAADEGFTYTNYQIELLTDDVKKHLFVPLCRSLRLPITTRFSLGFPLSSISGAMDSLRFTVGIESDDILHQYASVIAYISYLFNYVLNIRQLFELDADNKYALRMKRFEEAIKNFKHFDKLAPKLAKQSNHNQIAYGPFVTKEGNLYLVQDGKELICFVDQMVIGYYRESANLAFVIGSAFVSGLMATADQVNAFIKGATKYTYQNKPDLCFQHFQQTKKVTGQFIPSIINAVESRIMMDDDPNESAAVLSHNGHTFRLQHAQIHTRSFTSGMTIVEIDLWYEKDAAVARYLRFMMAVYLKEQYGFDFMPKGLSKHPGTMYSIFLFKMHYKTADAIIAAEKAVYDNREALLRLISPQAHASRAEAGQTVYHFHDGSAIWDLGDVDYFKGPSTFCDASLIHEAVKVFGIKRVGLISGYRENHLFVRSASEQASVAPAFVHGSALNSNN